MDPSDTNLDQSRMRDHFISCIESSFIKSFPTSDTPQMRTALRSSKRLVLKPPQPPHPHNNHIPTTLDDH